MPKKRFIYSNNDKMRQIDLKRTNEQSAEPKAYIYTIYKLFNATKNNRKRYFAGEWFKMNKKHE